MRVLRATPRGSEEARAEGLLGEIFGFDVQAIPKRPPRRTPDFRVDDGEGPGYLVEVKRRYLPDGFGEGSEPEFRTKPTDFDAKVSAWLEDASQQFVSEDPNHERFWILWTEPGDWPGSDSYGHTIMSSLYGILTAIEIMDPERQYTCYYAQPADLDAYPAIDAVGIAFWRPEGLELALCLNEASPRLEALKASALVRRVAEEGFPVVVPSEIDEEGFIPIPRGVCTQKNGPASLRFLQEKLGIQLLAWMREHQLVGVASVKLRVREP